MNYFKAFALAFNMLSTIPFFKVHHFFSGINGLSAMFYPLVGFILGAILWGIQTLLQDYLPSPHIAVIIIALWVLITGALHIDGLSDSIDGLFVSKEKSLAVMKDSYVGGMGMTFTFVFLALKLSSLIYFDAYYLLPVLLMLSRFNATLGIYFYKYISSGVGALIKKELEFKHILFTGIYTVAIAFAFGFHIAFFVSIVVLLVSAKFFTSRLGGLNGDVYGFIIEVSELFLLNYIIISTFS